MPTTATKSSFGASVAQADAAIRKQRAETAVKQDAADAATAAETEHEKKVEAEIQAKLPEKVASEMLGVVSYGVFKKHYQAVWDQVAEKRHLVAGRLTFTTQIAGAPLIVRSMTQREQRAMTAYEPPPANMTNLSHAERADKAMDYNVRRIVVQVERINDLTFPVAKLSPETRESWEKDAAVRQAYDVVQDWDPILVSHLLGILADLDQAKYFALVENLRNT